jgi:hypothetical protein
VRHAADGRQVIAAQITPAVRARAELSRRQVALVEQAAGQVAAGEDRFAQRAADEQDRPARTRSKVA